MPLLYKWQAPCLYCSCRLFL